MDAGSSEWHGEAMLDKGIRTRYGGLPLMLSRQNPCGEPATSPLLPAFCRAFGLRTRILTESPPPRPPRLFPLFHHDISGHRLAVVDMPEQR